MVKFAFVERLFYTLSALQNGEYANEKLHSRKYGICLFSFSIWVSELQMRKEERLFVQLTLNTDRGESQKQQSKKTNTIEHGQQRKNRKNIYKFN
jgi:hypothetical protein